MRINRKNTTCLVIDLQEKLFPVIEGGDQLLKNCLLMVRGFQVLGIPLIITQQYSKGLGPTIPALSSEISDFRYIEKRDFSCCGEPEVMKELNRLNAQTVVLCGIESHVCVLQTAIDLKAAGFIPVVAADAVASRFRVNYELALERFRHENILMTSAESLLFELTATSASPLFKTISSLVK